MNSAAAEPTSASYPVACLSRPPRAVVRVPGSKSLTNRALPLAALAAPSQSRAASVITHPLRSDDTEIMIGCLRQLGVPIEARWEHDRLTVPCVPRSRWSSTAELFCGNSGTTMRFLTAMLALGHGRFRLDGVPRMRERPIGDLLDALQALGVDARSEQDNGCPPVILHAAGLAGGEVAVRGGTSSQFLSGLLLAAPFAQAPMHLRVAGDLVSEPYIAMTVGLMRQLGLEVHTPEPGRFDIPAPQALPAFELAVEPDASAASYFFGAAALTGGTITVPGFHQKPDGAFMSLQGDVEFLRLLQAMGCLVHGDAIGATVTGPGQLIGLDADMNAISDTVMTLAVVALFAQGPTTIRNVAHIRHKETDRLAALAAELRKVGGAVEEFPDGLRITPRPLHGATLDTYDDHRLAMSLALIGLRVPGIVIRDPGCVAKTYPNFWRDLELLHPF
jgi:3-phosphoshikimate 1-carboxyvinyltransferase